MIGGNDRETEKETSHGLDFVCSLCGKFGGGANHPSFGALREFAAIRLSVVEWNPIPPALGAFRKFAATGGAGRAAYPNLRIPSKLHITQGPDAGA